VLKKLPAFDGHAGARNGENKKEKWGRDAHLAQKHWTFGVDSSARGRQVVNAFSGGRDPTGEGERGTLEPTRGNRGNAGAT